ncbi:MAG: Xaa-Pro dipeptidase [Gammaproteobacteria bacterium]
MTQATLISHYPAHLATVQARYDEALAANAYDGVLIGAGSARLQFMDDQQAPFRANPQLLQWLPLNAHPDACLLYQPGQAPVAVMVRPTTYWEEPPAAPGSPWADRVELRIVGEREAAIPALGALPPRLAVLAPEPHLQDLVPPEHHNPEALVEHLHYQRAWKTDYEVSCQREATTQAVRGHRAAARAHAAGESEFEILLAFQRASGQATADMPYPPIIGAGRHAATLHYQHYRQTSPSAGSLLIDAGCNAQGYASDITRTHVLAGNPAFAELRDDLDLSQQRLCARVRPQVPFAELHHAAHEEIAALLVAHDLVKGSAESVLERGLSRFFFPHGLGHLLGLQVHDVGGRQAGPDGGDLPAPARYPHLRLLRTLEPGFTLTIEPGLYFIESLLQELRDEPAGAEVNWDRVETLMPLGGIRIEDNVRVTANGAENLTRDAFASVPH